MGPWPADRVSPGKGPPDEGSKPSIRKGDLHAGKGRAGSRKGGVYARVDREEENARTAPPPGERRRGAKGPKGDSWDSNP